MKLNLFGILLFVTCSSCYAQYSDIELSSRFKYHDFANSPVGKITTQKRGKIKFEIVIKEGGRLDDIKTVGNDFDSEVERICRDEIELLEFIPPSFYNEESYQRIVVFKFKRKFKSFGIF